VQGDVVHLLFDFTRCPDSGPLTGASLKHAMGQNGARCWRATCRNCHYGPIPDMPGEVDVFVSCCEPSSIGLAGPEERVTDAWSSCRGIRLDGRGRRSS
jgi:hypothetical protein